MSLIFRKEERGQVLRFAFSKKMTDLFSRVQKYLGLPPGWRFPIAGGYENVGYDESLLED